jgi:hypothetical protein
LSAIVHILFALYIGRNQSFIQLEQPRAIKVRIIETAPPKELPVAVKPSLKKTTSKKNFAAKNATPTPDENDDEKYSEKPVAPSSYKDLFPGSTWGSGSVSVGNTSRTPTQVSSETKKISGELEGQLDIPLVFRENTASSKAVAKFRRTADGTWMFEYIDGEPVLRAVVFQAFQNKSNLNKIIELSKELKTNEILFVLEQITKPAINGMKQFEDNMTFSGIRIIYTRMIFSGHDGSSGIPLPDPEAARAKLRDRVALKRLMDNPAYHSPIRNRKID